MTEFEEDLKKKLDSEQVPMYITQSGCSITRKTYIETNWIFDTYKNWRSDEHVQNLVELGGSYVLANENLIDANAKLAEEIANLKSQLQQQAPPVVPECVGDAIAWDEQIDNSIAETLKNVFTFGDRGLKEAGLWIKNNPEKYIIARNIGYTVEKPQMFYLKNKLTDMYLYKKPLGGYGEEPADSIKNLTDDFKFTQNEIDKIDVQGYDKKRCI